MAAVREEYLEYRERVDDEMSRSRLKISELKDQLANFDTSFSKDMSKSMFIESSFKTKAQGFGTFDSREALEGVEKFTDQHFTLDSRKPQVNQIQLHDNDDDDNEEDNEDEYLARNENIQAMRDLGSPIEEERTVENLNQNSPDQYRIIKETYETLGRLKQQTLNDIGNLQYKKQEYSSIEKHFKDKVVEVSETDEMIKQEINEVKERLEILKVIKIREKQMSAKNKKKWLEAMRQLQNKITTLKTKEKELNVQLQSIRQEAEDFHTLQMKKFKQVLRETELAHEKVAKERLAVGDRLEEAEEEAGEIEIKIEFAEDQGKLKRMQVEELTERISMLKADIARFEKEHSDLIASYNVKRNLEKQMKELEDKISKMQLDVNEMEEAKINKQMRIDLAEQEIEKQKNAINRIDETIKLTKEENEIAIKKIEVYFNRKKRETEMDSPGYTVQASLRRFDTMKLSDEIRVEEGSVVASKKNELLSNVKRTIDVLAQQIKEKAIDLRHTIETIKSHEKHRGNSNEDWKVKNALQTKFQDLTKEFWDLKMKKIKTELRLKHREMTIDRFVEEQNSLKPELERTILYNMKHLPFDNEIAEHVIDEKIRKPGCISPEENIERVVSDFYDMVRDREQKIQNLYEKQKQEELKDLNNISDDDYYYRKTELTDLKIAANKLQREIDQIKANIEIEILDKGNNIFNKVYKENLADKARKMEKLYGPKSVNQFKGKHKRDITDATYASEHRRITNYQSALDLLDSSQTELKNLNQELENEDAKNLKDLAAEKLKAQDKVRRLREQLVLIADAEKQLSKQIEKAIKNKEDELKDKMAEIYKDRKYSELEEELSRTKDDIDSSEDEYREKLNASGFIDNDQSQDIDQDAELVAPDEVNTELLQEDIELKKKLDDLKKAGGKIKKDIQPNLKGMEEEMAALSEEIKQLTVKINVEYETYKLDRDNLMKHYNNMQFEEKDGLINVSELQFGNDLDEEIDLLKEGKQSDLLNKSIEVRRSVANLNASMSRTKTKSKIEKTREGLGEDSQETGLAQMIPNRVALSQLTSSLEISLQGTNTVYSVNMEDASPLEIEFFENIL